jgi:hypothetical protein
MRRGKTKRREDPVRREHAEWRVQERKERLHRVRTRTVARELHGRVKHTVMCGARAAQGRRVGELVWHRACRRLGCGAERDRTQWPDSRGVPGRCCKGGHRGGGRPS